MNSDFIYAKFKEDVKHAENESAPLWNLQSLEKGHLLAPSDFGVPFHNVYDGFEDAALKYPERHCLGTRVGNEYKWTTYEQTHTKIVSFSKGMLKL